MEELWKVLGVTKGLTAVIGSGGKTSLLYELAEELRPCGTVLLATTTHIMRPLQYPFVQTPEELAAALAAGGVACVGSLTPEGKLLSSEQLADTLRQAKSGGRSSACFLIGSSFGIAPELKKLADLQLSMSKMTFPHHLARVMALEQLYRAEAIQAGSKYHK